MPLDFIYEHKCPETRLADKPFAKGGELPAGLHSLAEVLHYRAQATPDRNAYIYLRDGENDEQRITYGELDRQAQRIAAVLQAQGCRGERVLLMYPQGLEFITAFFGCIYAGAVAVLVYPPTNERMARRMEGIISDCALSQILTSTEVAAGLNRLIGAERDSGSRTPGLAALPRFLTDSLNADQSIEFRDEIIGPDDLAFLQYTSGSTGTPKGVMVSHGNIIANQKAIQHLFEHGSESCTVSWLPMLHDMGLIGSTLQPLYMGYPLVFMAPLHFMQRPVRWLRAISRYRATSSGGPNFAYDYCVSKVREKDKHGLDLSSWKAPFNGAEPVRQDTLQRFYNAFAQCGLRPNAQIGVYGLAEATLILTGARHGEQRPVDEETGCVSSGRAAPQHEIRIVDPETRRELADGACGEIWASGPSIAQGYWGRPDATAETFHATLADGGERFLRTGDMGYVKHGQLFVTGRIKDLILVRGRNYHAEDIEWSLQDIAGLRSGYCAAFLLDSEDPDSLTIVAGVDSPSSEDRSELIDAIVARIYEDYQLPVARIVLVKSKYVPKTTSGKVQRRLTRQRYRDGELQPLLDHRVGTQTVGETAAAPAPGNKPKTAQELELARIWAELLDLEPERIGLHDNFFALGGHSLLMLELASRLDVSLELLFRYPTIASFLNRSGEYQFPDTASDIWLPPQALDPQVRASTRISLITGGNGLFGFHLLVSLLARTDDHFICLIRGRDQAEVNEKFHSTAAYYKLSERIDMSRITLLPGDFGQEKLGLSDERYARLAQQVQRIYHIGSHVNNWLPYEGIRDVNVEGTRRLLTLARTGRRKAFHYASTSTFSPDKADKAVFLETDNIDPADINKYNGYDISKYVSEQLCRLARRDGIECNIYRLVWVGGQHASGLSKVNDGLNIMLRILVTLGIFPQGNYLHDVIPVDLMAEAVASVQSKASNVAFNITSQSNESIDMHKIVAMLRGLGYRLEEVSRDEFVRRLKDYPDAQWDRHCRSYRQLIIRLFDEDVKPESYYDSTNLKRYLDAEVRERLERKFVDDWFCRAVLFMVRNGALPTPSGQRYQDDMARIARWNDTAADYPRERCIHQLFETQVAKTPDAIALVFDDRRWTYAELNRRANAFAAYLCNLGIVPEERVGVCLERGFDLYAAILGIIKAGGAYVPLCPSYPAETLDYMVGDSDANIVFTSSRTRDAANAFANRAHDIDSPKLARRLAANVPEGVAFSAAAPAAHHLAYVIYTSGTTGKPKGVMIEHRGVVNHNLSLTQRFGLSPADNMLQFATMNFDSFVEEVFPVLATGAALTLIRERDRRDPERLKAIIRRCGVTLLKLPTAFWHSLAGESFEGLGIRLVGIGGEEADVRKFRRWTKANPTIPVLNTYGPTEITITASVAELDSERAWGERLPIGTPIRNTQAHILDNERQPVPIGTPGELYIAGDGLARGYLNREQETSEAFLEVASAPGGRLYRTGDLARWTPAGEIEFLGRSDNQVKVRGYRIELAAIESVLNEHPQIANAAVVLKTLQNEKRVVAYCASNDDGPEPSHLKGYLRQRLPAYMLPDAIVPLARLPLNPNGKLDRAELERLAFSMASAYTDYAAPETELQQNIAALWSNLLGIERVGIDDDFLDLGGHSLLAITLLQRLYQELGVKLCAEDLYANFSIRRLSALIESPARREHGLSSLVAFPRANDAGALADTVCPLFLIHGVGGNLASFYPLARHIQQTMVVEHAQMLPVYGLQANATEGAGFGSAAEMVEAYIRHITEVQPRGPYVIGGWSYGVGLAFEIAQALIRRGERIKAFVSIDAQAPTSHPDVVEFLQERDIRSTDDLYQDRHLAAALARFGHKFGFADGGGADLKVRLCRFLGYPDAIDSATRDRYNRVAVANMHNARDFDPGPLQTERLLLIKATQSEFDDYEARWLSLVGAGQVLDCRVEGDHWSIMGEPETARHIATLMAGL
jgi:amino acid adenylation domain-containing protein/thioester reductase-like protein